MVHILAVSLKLKIYLPYHPTTSRYLTKRNERISPHNGLHMNVHSSFLSNSWKQEIIRRVDPCINLFIKILKSVNLIYSDKKLTNVCLGTRLGGERKGEITKEHKETSRGDRCVHYLDLIVSTQQKLNLFKNVSFILVIPL